MPSLVGSEMCIRDRPGPGQGLCRWPLQASHGKGRGKFQTLWSLRAPQEPQVCFPRNRAILLHCLKESSRKKVLNALVKSIFRCRFVEKRAKDMLLKVRVAADSKLCCPLAPFRPRRIPNLASLLAVPFDANLTVCESARSGFEDHNGRLSMDELKVSIAAHVPPSMSHDATAWIA